MVLGVYHDNPSHHQVQADFVSRVQPRALVFEMLTAAQAKRAAGVPHCDMHALETALGWQGRGWPSFEHYFPTFAAAPEAVVFGAAVPRAQARLALSAGLVDSFGPEAARFGLAEPPPEHEQIARQAVQMAVHCDVLSVQMLPGMVDMQRLRDGRLAQSALNAIALTGGPVAVITGNGHARTDWGIAVCVLRADPSVTLYSLAQTEAEAPLEGRLMQSSAQGGLSAMIPARRSNSIVCTIACHSVVISLLWTQQREGET